MVLMYLYDIVQHKLDLIQFNYVSGIPPTNLPHTGTTSMNTSDISMTWRGFCCYALLE